MVAQSYLTRLPAEPGMERMSTQDAPLIIALAICLGLSYAAVKIGMAAIIGAFFAGLAFGFIGSNQGVYAPPREYGLELRYHFGG